MNRVDGQIALDPGGQIVHIDLDMMRLKLRLTPGQRILAMLDSHELVVGVIRGRLMRQRPELSHYEIGLLVVEEIEHAKEYEFRPLPLFPRPPEARGT